MGCLKLMRCHFPSACAMTVLHMCANRQPSWHFLERSLPVCTKSFSASMAGHRWSHLPLDLMHRIAGGLDTAKDLCNFERVSRACWWATLVSR